MRQIKIEVSEDTYGKMHKLASIVDYLVKNEKSLSPEDIVYAALSFYLDRFYPNLIIPQNHDQLFALSTNFPLKNRFRKYFDDLNISQSAIAKQLNIPKTTINNIINNKNQPTVDLFLKIYPLLGFPPLHEIFYRETCD